MNEITILHELVRRMHSLISPMSYDDTLKDLQTKSATDVFKGSEKQCIMPWKMGAQQLNLPVCNRFGMVDPQMINFSKKIVNKMKSIHPDHDESATIVISKLDRMYNRYNRDIPNPPHRAAMNGQVTKFRNRILNKLKGHLT